MTRKPTRARGLGVDDATYARMLEAQDGHCAICPSTPKTRRLHVDHDHVTGAVRGLLCMRCNRFLASYNATPERLRVAADYLERPPVSIMPDARASDPPAALVYVCLTTLLTELGFDLAAATNIKLDPRGPPAEVAARVRDPERSAE